MPAVDRSDKQNGSCCRPPCRASPLNHPRPNDESVACVSSWRRSRTLLLESNSIFLLLTVQTDDKCWHSLVSCVFPHDVATQTLVTHYAYPLPLARNAWLAENHAPYVQQKIHNDSGCLCVRVCLVCVCSTGVRIAIRVGKYVRTRTYRRTDFQAFSFDQRMSNTHCTKWVNTESPRLGITASITNTNTHKHEQAPQRSSTRFVDVMNRIICGATFTRCNPANVCGTHSPATVVSLWKIIEKGNLSSKKIVGDGMSSRVTACCTTDELLEHRHRTKSPHSLAATRPIVDSVSYSHSTRLTSEARTVSLRACLLSPWLWCCIILLHVAAQRDDWTCRAVVAHMVR